MGLLTVFANFRIDSEERFLRLQDSFRSFRDANIARWVVNVRGPLAGRVRAFLGAELGDSLRLHELNSPQGWFHDSRQMLADIESRYVMVWVEDLVCVAGAQSFDEIVAGMDRLDAEYLLYTAFHDGDSIRSFDCLAAQDGGEIVVVEYDAASHKRRMEFIRDRRLTCATFIISGASIVSRELFARLLTTNDPLVKRWPKETPFDFEKTQRDIHWLPLRVAQTKGEFFAYIDDDHGRPNHSLISRGLYPNRMSRDTMLEIREADLKSRRSPLRTQLAYYARETVNLGYTRIVRALVGRS